MRLAPLSLARDLGYLYLKRSSARVLWFNRDCQTPIFPFHRRVRYSIGFKRSKSYLTSNLRLASSKASIGHQDQWGHHSPNRRGRERGVPVYNFPGVGIAAHGEHDHFLTLPQMHGSPAFRRPRDLIPSHPSRASTVPLCRYRVGLPSSVTQ